MKALLLLSLLFCASAFSMAKTTKNFIAQELVILEDAFKEIKFQYSISDKSNVDKKRHDLALKSITSAIESLRTVGCYRISKASCDRSLKKLVENNVADEKYLELVKKSLQLN